MRSLNIESPASIEQENADEEFSLICELSSALHYEKNLAHLKDVHHSNCIFNRPQPLLPGLVFRFDNKGIIHSSFICGPQYQGYDQMIHGGIIGAIIDASMAQCLMGHGIIAYTADLSIRYRKPLLINKTALLETSITEVTAGTLYRMKCEITQGHNLSVTANARFFKVKEQ